MSEKELRRVAEHDFRRCAACQRVQGHQFERELWIRYVPRYAILTAKARNESSPSGSVVTYESFTVSAVRNLNPGWFIRYIGLHTVTYIQSLTYSHFSFSGWDFFWAFTSVVRQMSRKFRPHPLPDIISYHNHQKSFITGTNDRWCWDALKPHNQGWELYAE